MRLKLCIVVLFAMSNATHVLAQKWWQKATAYEIFVRSFQDFNNDGKGDFYGMLSRLNHLNDGDSNTYTDLGIGAVWLMPINPSPSYHGYDVTNYKAVNKDYGTMEEFKEMLAEAHKRDIKVIIDLVINHTSSQHPWFSKSAANDTFYRNFYRWSSTVQNTNGPWGQQVWYQRNGSYYYALFWSEMPDLNYDYPPVQDSIFDIARFWIKEVGVDGFRLDAAMYLFEEGNTLKNHPKTIAFWQAFNDSCKSWNPNSYIIGEVWDSKETLLLYKNKLDQCFDFELADNSVNAVNNGNTAAWRSSQAYAYQNYDYGSFLTNHDQNRIASVMGNNQGKLMAAASLYLLHPGTPYLYYGEEVAMLGTKPDENIRRPMQWSNSAYAGFSGVEPWRALNTNYATYNVASLTANQASITNHYRKLIHFRNKYGAVAYGNYKNLISTQNEVIVSHRYTSNQDVYVMVSCSPNTLNNVQFTFTRSDGQGGTHTLRDVMTDSLITLTASGNVFSLSLPMAPFQTRILRFEPSTGDNQISPVEKACWIYPNPAKDRLQVELSGFTGSKTLRLINSQGQTLQEQEMVGNASELTLAVAPGLYFIEVISPQGSLVKKVWIE